MVKIIWFFILSHVWDSTGRASFMMKPLRFRGVAQTQVLSVLCPCPLLSQFSPNPVHNHSMVAQASTTHIPTKTFKERKGHLLICLFTPTFCRNLSAVHSLLKKEGAYIITLSLNYFFDFCDYTTIT